jgi:hypothetical protein
MNRNPKKKLKNDPISPDLREKRFPNRHIFKNGLQKVAKNMKGKLYIFYFVSGLWPGLAKFSSTWSPQNVCVFF